MTHIREHALASSLMLAIGIAVFALSTSRTAAGVFLGGALVELGFLAWSLIAPRGASDPMAR